MKRIAVVLLAGMAFGLGSASAEAQVGSNFETRTVVALRVGAAVQKWLPSPWQLNPMASGPSKDANALLVFINPWSAQDPDGKPTAVPIDRRVALAIPGKHPQSGESAVFVARVYTSNPKGAPGPYKNSVPVTVLVEQTLKAAGIDSATGSEEWEVRDGAGGTIELRLQYQRGVAGRLKVESKPRAAADANFFRIYRVDQGMDVVRSVPAGVDRVQQYSLKVTIPELRPMFDGSEQLVSVSLLPWYLRQVSLP